MQSEALVTRREIAAVMPEAVRAVAAAAEQITVALKEAQQPVEQLGASVSRIIVTVGSLRSASEGLADPERDPVVQELIDEALARLSWDAAQATVTLQFYDRMTQHLTHLHDYLAGISELLACRNADAGCGGDIAGWPELQQKLSQRLMSELQRQHLQGMTPAEWGAKAMSNADSAQRSPNSSVELF